MSPLLFISTSYNNLQLANEFLYSNWQSLTLAQQSMIQKHVNVLAVNCWSVSILSIKNIIRCEQTDDRINYGAASASVC